MVLQMAQRGQLNEKVIGKVLQLEIHSEWLTASQTLIARCIALCIHAAVSKVEIEPASSMVQQSLRMHKLLHFAFSTAAVSKSEVPKAQA